MTSGCGKFLNVFYHDLSNVKAYTYRTYTCIIRICIIKSIRRSTQGSSIGIDRLLLGRRIYIRISLTKK